MSTAAASVTPCITLIAKLLSSNAFSSNVEAIRSNECALSLRISDANTIY